MALDDVVRTTITGPRIEEAMYRTLRWMDRCIAGTFLTFIFFIFLFGKGLVVHFPKVLFVYPDMLKSC